MDGVPFIANANQHSNKDLKTEDKFTRNAAKDLNSLYTSYTQLCRQGVPFNDESQVEIASEICTLLEKDSKYDLLEAFLNQLPFSQHYQTNEVILRAKINLAVRKEDTTTVKNLLTWNLFGKHDGLLEIWDKVHYFDEEKRIGKILSPLARFRIRKRNPPPHSICPGGVRKTASLPKVATKVLRDWLVSHDRDPYPTLEEKRALARMTGLTVTQVKTWFANARRRIFRCGILKKKTNDGAHLIGRRGSVTSETVEDRSLSGSDVSSNEASYDAVPRYDIAPTIPENNADYNNNATTMGSFPNYQPSYSYRFEHYNQPVSYEAAYRGAFHLHQQRKKVPTHHVPTQLPFQVPHSAISGFTVELVPPSLMQSENPIFYEPQCLYNPMEDEMDSPGSHFSSMKLQCSIQQQQQQHLQQQHQQRTFQQQAAYYLPQMSTVGFNLPVEERADIDAARILADLSHKRNNSYQQAQTSASFHPWVTSEIV